MAIRKKVSAEPPLPELDALPPRALDHPTLHAIINAYGWGKSKKALVADFGLPVAYINAVIYQYLEKYGS